MGFPGPIQPSNLTWGKLQVRVFSGTFWIPFLSMHAPQVGLSLTYLLSCWGHSSLVKMSMTAERTCLTFRRLCSMIIWSEAKFSFPWDEEKNCAISGWEKHDRTPRWPRHNCTPSLEWVGGWVFLCYTEWSALKDPGSWTTLCSKEKLDQLHPGEGT